MEITSRGAYVVAYMFYVQEQRMKTSMGITNYSRRPASQQTVEKPHT